MVSSHNTAGQIPPASPQAAREVRRNSPIRQARTCYDHLAGVAGVSLLDSLLQWGWLAQADFRNGRPHYRLTPAGERALAARYVDLARAGEARRIYAYGCLDWTERHLHLGGALGAALLESLTNAGIVRREPASRVATMRKSLECWLDDAPPERK